MKRLFYALIVLLWMLPAFAQVPMTGGGKGVPGGGSSYTGPGDVVTYYQAYGLMAYTSATRGNVLVNVCNSTAGVDVGCGDLSSDVTTGLLVPATISAITCPGANCTIKTFYDLTGGGIDCTNTTVATRATLPSSGGPGTSHPNAAFTRANSQTYSCPAKTGLIAPFIMSAITIRTGTTTSFNTVIGSANPEILFGTAANSCGIYAGNVFTDTTHCADSAWHAISGLFDATGTACKLNIDNNLTTGGNCGTGITTTILTLGSGVGGLLDGGAVFMGYAAGDQSTNFTSLNSAFHTIWGF